jgi:hypothetical protein
MKQYRISTENFTQSSESDCALSPDDPIHDMIASQYMGGLGAAQRISERKAKLAEELAAAREPLLQYARNTGIKPGTPAWYALTGTLPTKHR